MGIPLWYGRDGGGLIIMKLGRPESPLEDSA